MNPLISIIVPCYNQAKYLDECLQSVIDQTFQEWECLIINDGSPDNTEEISKKWTAIDSRFKYYLKANGGVASARNLGLKEARGKWILPLDGDDKIHKDYLSSALQKATQGYDLIYCRAEFFGIKNEEFILPSYSMDNLLRSNVIFVTALFNKEKLQGISYDENLVHGFEDWDFWISYLRPDSKVFRLEQTLFYYRIKHVSRNEDITANAVKMNEAKSYIFEKHKEKYYQVYGDYFTLFKKLIAKEKENSRLQTIINSKRYMIVNKFLNIFKL